MSRHVTMQWNLRQVMAERGIFQTSELLPLLEARGIHISREHVYRLVTRTPLRVNVEILAALCDALGCTPNELMTPVVENPMARTGSDNTAAGLADRGARLGGIRPVRATVRRPHDQ
jgi:DNA-binding Xre family transcriptional regulator